MRLITPVAKKDQQAVSVKIDKQVAWMLDEYCRYMGRSKSEVVQPFIEYALKQDKDFQDMMRLAYPEKCGNGPKP